MSCSLFRTFFPKEVHQNRQPFCYKSNFIVFFGVPRSKNAPLQTPHCLGVNFFFTLQLPQIMTESYAKNRKYIFIREGSVIAWYPGSEGISGYFHLNLNSIRIPLRPPGYTKFFIEEQQILPISYPFFESSSLVQQHGVISFLCPYLQFRSFNLETEELFLSKIHENCKFPSDPPYTILNAHSLTFEQQ